MYRNNDDYEIAQFSREYEEQRLVREFADYLNVGEISGTLRGVPKGSIINAEYVIPGNAKVEVLKEDGLDDGHDHQPITVMLHRDDYGDVRSIEVVCSCGKKAQVYLEYEDDAERTASRKDTFNFTEDDGFTEFGDDYGNTTPG